MDSASPVGSPSSVHASPSTPPPSQPCFASDAPTSPQESAQFKNALTRELFGRKMTVITWQNRQFLIGVQIAHYLKRETFNLYRSMKLANIDILKCQPAEIEELTQLDAIKRGIHSVTLVPYDQGVMYISKELRRKPRKKSEKKMRAQGDQHSAQPPSPGQARPLRTSFESLSGSAEASPAEEDSAASHGPADEVDHVSESSGCENLRTAPVALKRLHWSQLLMIATAERMRLMEEGAASS